MRFDFRLQGGGKFYAFGLGWLELIGESGFARILATMRTAPNISPDTRKRLGFSGVRVTRPGTNFWTRGRYALRSASAPRRLVRDLSPSTTHQNGQRLMSAFPSLRPRQRVFRFSMIGVASSKTRRTISTPRSCCISIWARPRCGTSTLTASSLASVWGRRTSNLKCAQARFSSGPMIEAFPKDGMGISATSAWRPARQGGTF